MAKNKRTPSLGLPNVMAHILGGVHPNPTPAKPELPPLQPETKEARATESVATPAPVPSQPAPSGKQRRAPMAPKAKKPADTASGTKVKTGYYLDPQVAEALDRLAYETNRGRRHDNRPKLTLSGLVNLLLDKALAEYRATPKTAFITKAVDEWRESHEAGDSEEQA